VGAVVVADLCSAAAPELVRGDWFCSNEDCVLHVRIGDPGVRGSGEWAVRPDGIVTSRQVVHGRMLCDVCGQAAR
jgi:hypothetical protein